jgi:hypothetical protein
MRYIEGMALRTGDRVVGIVSRKLGTVEKVYNNGAVVRYDGQRGTILEQFTSIDPAPLEVKS